MDDGAQEEVGQAVAPAGRPVAREHPRDRIRLRNVGRDWLNCGWSAGQRLMQQQDAAMANPAAIRASLPEQGRLLTFTGPLQVDTWADLKLKLELTPVRTVSGGVKLLMVAALLLLVALLTWAAHGKQPQA